ncbi:enoyl-CoA hydratase/isomerase family protein [bacterium]|nr:enoyl-CoA hydratase/isomerase family protein [bacterium]
MEFNNLLLEVKDGLAVLTINRPDKLNALNNEVMREIKAAFEHIRDNDEIKAVVVTGAGDKAFVAGADITEIHTLDQSSGAHFAQQGHDIFTLIEKLPKPVIAAVNGFALGGGCELAMACHVRLANENARFGQPEVGLGITPGYGGTQRLPRLVGKGRALEMILSGNMVRANEAHAMGLVNHVYPADELMDKAEELARGIMSKGPAAVAMCIRLVNEGLDMPLDDAKAHEAKLFGEICATGDMKEGTKAFMEKRKPNFTGK